MTEPPTITMTPENSATLRRAFPSSVIGKLPRKGAELEYVGHAAVTDRLLAVDSAWSWEPLALDEQGLPRLDADGNLWIRLSVCGVTRLGVGDGASMKERIGDAIRNAAMRFGVALDLWTKNELERAGGGEDANVDPSAFLMQIAAAEDTKALDAMVADIQTAPLTRADRSKVREAWTARREELKVG